MVKEGAMTGISTVEEAKESRNSIDSLLSDCCNENGYHLIEKAHDMFATSNDSLISSADEENSMDIGDNATIEGVLKRCNESILMHDSTFTIFIASPGMEPFEQIVSSLELVHEIHQLLMDREDCCHRTCFSLQLDNNTLDNFVELKSIDSLTEGSVIKVVEEPYTIREARIHVRHVRDLLKSVDCSDAYTGVDCASLSFLNSITSGDVSGRRHGKLESVDYTPPDYIMPGCKDRPLLHLHPSIKDMKGPLCLKVLTYSGWNPPPGIRKMHGDLLYVYVVTLEGKRYHITASTHGFYLNQITDDIFNPKAAHPKYLCHSLIDLLSQISPLFKKNFVHLLKRRSLTHPFERVPTPYQVYTWLAPLPDHRLDYIRAEDAFATRLGYEEHIPGQTRDWNEEIQSSRELPQVTFHDRIVRERTIFKVHSDFVAAATRGAQAVIDGNVMAINPGEDSKMQMFIWNNIFFSLGFDVKDHYKDFGGDAAAYAAPGNDLQGVKAYFNLDTEGLFTLGTVLVDYRGYRITAQSIIPGILEKEQEHSVVYGSVDFGKTVVSNDKYKELLTKSASQLRIRPHKVLNSKKEEVEMMTSIECKGIVGNDKRHYILDLLRTFPPDINFLPDEEESLSNEVGKLGFPRRHRHKLPCLRQELIEAFVENRYVAFVRHVTFQFQNLQMIDRKMDKCDEVLTEISWKALEDDVQLASRTTDRMLKEDSDDEVATDEAEKIVQNLSTNSDSQTTKENVKNVVRKAAKMVDSLCDTEFSISFNPDVFQFHVTHSHSNSDDFQKEKKLVKNASEFLVLHQIPTLIGDCLDHSFSPIDGVTFSEAMHARGINIRYLGKVAEMFSKHSTLDYVFNIAVAELVCRGTKHLFKVYMQGVEMMNLSSAVSHFLNCLLGSYPTPHAQVNADELQTKARKKNRRKTKQAIFVIDNTEWMNITPTSLWRKIVDEVNDYFGFRLECDSIESASERFSLQRVSLLRAFCQAAGVQLLLHDINFDIRNRNLFLAEDIVNLLPVVKHISPRSTNAFNIFSNGQKKIHQGLLREGFDLMKEAHNTLNNVYGAMHSENAACLRLLARLNYIMGDYCEALSFQQRALLMTERVLGVDHPNTIPEYMHLALYCFASHHVGTALRLLYRARYLLLLCYGEMHPDVGLIDSNIGLMLQAAEEYELSLCFLENALALNIKYLGSSSLKVAVSYHLVARTHSCRGDFRAALSREKEAFGIYKRMLGEKHERTRESSECLRHLTKQAVVFQKEINRIYKGDRSISLPPIQIQTPSLHSVLETLNVINGIIFVQISQEELEKFRKLSKQQSLANNDDASLANNSDVSLAKCSDALQANSGDSLLANSDDASLTNNDDALLANNDDVSLANSGDASLANNSDVSLAKCSDALQANNDDASLSNDDASLSNDDASLANNSDVSLANNSDVSLAKCSDALLANSDDASLTNNDDALLANNDDVSLANSGDALLANNDDASLASNNDASLANNDDVAQHNGFDHAGINAVETFPPMDGNESTLPLEDMLSNLPNGDLNSASEVVIIDG